MLVWKKLAPVKWEDAWLERLGFIDPTRLAVTTLPGGKTIRIEAYSLTPSEAGKLTDRFGGEVRKLKTASRIPQPPPRAPIRIRKNLLIVASEREKKTAAKQFPGRHILVVPAAMAFGTGEHATTAACLRFLSDSSAALRGRPWEMLDLGAGSGILALAARMLGAHKVEAADFDPHAVRAARENIRGNALDAITVRKLDVTKWAPVRTWDVIAANLFSEILITAAPAIARASHPGTRLIFSGILRTQEKETVRAFVQNGFCLEALRRKGKWVTASALFDPRWCAVQGSNL